MPFNHKHLLGIEPLSKQEILTILDAFTIRQKKKILEDLKIVFAGDILLQEGKERGTTD